MPSDNVRCQRCNHSFSNHRKSCRWRKVHWDREANDWGAEEICDCKAYVGLDPKTLNECPHETLLIDPFTCVHCNKSIPVQKR